MDDKMCQCGHYESDHGADGSCCSSASTGYCPCFIFDDSGAPPDPRDAEIARLKGELSGARRHAVGVMAAGFNRALDEAGAPAAESPGLRVYAMRDEIARLKDRAEKAEAELAAIADAMHGPTLQPLAERVRGYVETCDRLNTILGALTAWTHEYGAALKPPGADTYGEGKRDAKNEVATILRGKP